MDFKTEAELCRARELIKMAISTKVLNRCIVYRLWFGLAEAEVEYEDVNRQRYVIVLRLLITQVLSQAFGC